MKLKISIIKEALRRFDMEPNSFFVGTPTRVSKDQRYHSSTSDSKLSPPLNPVTFLTRIFDEEEDFPNQLIARIPYFSFIVGQYGLGKTELVTQVCRFILKSNEYQDSGIVPLPVTLASCRKYLKDKDMSFGEFLFNDILSPLNISFSEIENDLLSDIFDGRIILLLDGLDELIQLEGRSVELHKWFLSSLAEFIATARQFSNGEEPKFKIVVSLREEYLAMVSSTDAKNFRETIYPHFPDGNINLYFLNLTFFDESRIYAYLLKRKKDNYKDYHLLEELAKNPDFKEIFHRPLLLRLLVDWLEYETADLNKLIEKLQTYNHPAYFIRFYIDTIVNDNKLRKTQDQILECYWDPTLIARRCLLMTEEGRQVMKLNDVRNILVPVTLAHVDDLTDEQVLAGIHKCPFLKKEFKDKDQEILFRFSHKIFFEYFTVEGVWLDLQEGRAKNGFGAFDELVLSVDMRKFLKAFVGEKWYERTAIAYGLGEKDWIEWQYTEVSNGAPIDIKNQEELNRLNEQRKIMLDTMSEPEEEKAGIEKTIHDFLSEEGRYHPRYLVPNYEAITVFIWNNIWSDIGKEYYSRFEKTLKERTDFIVKGLEKQDFKLNKEWLLLLERIFDIGYRLRFPWIRKLVDENRKNVESLLEKLKYSIPDTEDVIERILVSIFNIADAKVWEEQIN